MANEAKYRTTSCATLSITYRSIADLKLDPLNPRLHSKKQIRQIAASIEAFGFNVPILVDGQSTVVAGHGRILACIELGWTEVPVIRLENLTPAQAKAYQIADNLSLIHISEPTRLGMI